MEIPVVTIIVMKIRMFRYDGGVDECYHHYCSLSNYEQEYWEY